MIHARKVYLPVFFKKEIPVTIIEAIVLDQN